MKKVILMAFGLGAMISPILAQPEETTETQGVQFIMEDWGAAVSQAQEEGKFLMLDAYTEWCYWCKVQDKNTFENPEMAAYIEEHFVSLKVDMEKGIGIDLAAKFRVRSYPTLLFFNQHGQYVSSIGGYIEDLDQFKAALDEVMAITEEQPFAFDSQELNPGFPQWYIDSYNPELRRSNKVEPETVIAYLDDQEDLYSEVNFSIISGFAYSLNDQYRNHFLENREKYAELYPESQVQDLCYSFVMSVLREAIDEKNEDYLLKAVEMANTYFPDQPSMQNSLKTRYYQVLEDWRSFTMTVMAMIEESGVEEMTNQLNSYGWSLYQNCDDMECLQKATAWMKDVIAIESTDYNMIDTYAALLYKTGEYAEAKVQAESAIALGKEQGTDVEGTEDLLEKILAELDGDD